MGAVVYTGCSGDAFSLGGMSFFGSTGSLTLSCPIVSMATMPVVP